MIFRYDEQSSSEYTIFKVKESKSLEFEFIRWSIRRANRERLHGTKFQMSERQCWLEDTESNRLFLVYPEFKELTNNESTWLRLVASVQH